MDKRYNAHFFRIWNLNVTDLEDQLVLISLDDEALYSKTIGDAFSDIDHFLTGYANVSLEPTIFDEKKRNSHFSRVNPDVNANESDELSSVERLAADSFRSLILNDVSFGENLQNSPF
jgi:hypothetical protein